MVPTISIAVSFPMASPAAVSPIVSFAGPPGAPTALEAFRMTSRPWRTSMLALLAAKKVVVMVLIIALLTVNCSVTLRHARSRQQISTAIADLPSLFSKFNGLGNPVRELVLGATGPGSHATVRLFTKLSFWI